MIGEAIAHYRILSQLGEGGMGVVYLAEDTRLGRQVALKFLPPAITVSEEDGKRFEQEARAAARLNHPNICTIHAFDEHEGRPVIAMEYVEGETLQERMRGGALPTDEALDYAVQIAEAMAKAHDAGIVHRDVKPGNIMLTGDGRIKVMDFGLAKLRGADPITRTGSTIGTMAYMAPEQIQGQEVDQRADVFAFGVVLFEMLTGKRPHRGEHEAALVYSIVNEDPVPIRDFLPDAPTDLVAVLERTLAKDPDDRYGSTRDLVTGLKRSGDATLPAIPAPAGTPPEAMNSPTAPGRKTPAGRGLLKSRAGMLAILGALVAVIATSIVLWASPFSAPEEDRRSIAVLPFHNLSPNPDDAYFAGGIHSELLSHLSQIPGLRVISRTTMLRYEGTDRSVEEIARELNVATLMEAEVERIGDRVRIGTRLIDGRTDELIWSESYDGAVEDIHQVRTEVIRAVAGALRATLTERHERSLAERPTESIEAYEAYLDGIDKLTTEARRRSADEALARFQRAVELDHGFAEAWAGLARAHLAIYWWGEDPTTARLQAGVAAAQRAFTLDPANLTVRLALAEAHYRARDYDRALELTEAVLSEAPGMYLANAVAGFIYRRQGRWNESTRLLERSAEYDPDNSSLHFNLAVSYWVQGEFEEAIRSCERAIATQAETNPDLFGTLGDLHVAWRGDLSAARRAARRLPPHLHRDRNALLAWHHAQEGNYANGLARLEGVPDHHHLPRLGAIPVGLLRGLMFERIGRAEEAQSAYRDVVDRLERIIDAPEFDPRGQFPLRSVLALAYAGLGRDDDALRAANRSVDELPVAEDALRGPDRLLWLARVYTTLGDTDRAVRTLEAMRALDPLWTRSFLQHDPFLRPAD